MKTFILRHQHKHGTDIFKFKSEKDYTGYFFDETLVECKELCEKLEIDLEIDSNEVIEICEDTEFIPTI
jgi:hypothetical protein